MDKPTAVRFFAQLETFSFRCRVKLGLDGQQSPWGLEQLTGGRPKGAILHYTADGNTANVVRWFTDPALAAKASAHVVISDRICDWAQGLDKDLDLIQQLAVTVIQCRKPTEVAWHATWANASCYGIENVNYGELRPCGDGYAWWAAKDKNAPPWTAPYENDLAPVSLYGRYWQPYTTEQLTANVTVLRAVDGLFDNSLQPAWIVGHENVQGVKTQGGGNHDKRDTGPHFPLHEIRAAVSSGEVNSLMLANANPEFGSLWRTRIAYAALQALNVPGPYENTGWDAFLSVCRLPSALPNKTLIKSMLKILGYCTTDPSRASIEPEDAASIFLFQKLVGLQPDGLVSADLRAALADRLTDRYSLSARKPILSA